MTCLNNEEFQFSRRTNREKFIQQFNRAPNAHLLLFRRHSFQPPIILLTRQRKKILSNQACKFKVRNNSIVRPTSFCRFTFKIVLASHKSSKSDISSHSRKTEKLLTITVLYLVAFFNHELTDTQTNLRRRVIKNARLMLHYCVIPTVLVVLIKPYPLFAPK